MTPEEVATDGDAAARIYQQCFGELVGYLERMLGERGAAEEVAQDAGMKLIESARRAPLELRVPRAFLFHVATNLARDRLRRRVRQARAMDEIEHEESGVPGADVVAGARQEVDRLSVALATLPDRPRSVLLLARVEGLSHAEIGLKLGIAPKTVENHLGRALTMLAQRLGREKT
jgi:RNA polymerase sigma factor (sigma-70 family)